jgi:2-oxoglutarate ferredoxin oxidoreductase subunit beta
MHDGSEIRLHKLQKDWDPTNRRSAMNAVQNAKDKGEILTGLLYIDESSQDLHELINTSEKPLNSLGKAALCPGSEMLAKLNTSLR